MAPAQRWVCVFGLLVFLFYVDTTDTANLNLIILHTNDILSHYEDFNETFGDCKDNEINISTQEPTVTTEYASISTEFSTITSASVNTTENNSRQSGENSNKISAEDSVECFGGLARLATKSQEYISSKDDDTLVLFLNSGNTFGETIWHPILGWSPAAFSVKTLGYNVMSLGEREFEDGVQHLTNFLRNTTSECAVVAANIDSTMEKDFVNYFNLSYVVTHNKHKIGIIGYTSKKAEYMSDPGKLKFSSEMEAVKGEAKILTEQGVKIIIALGSAGIDVAKEIANYVEDVDIVVSGGGKTFLYNSRDSPPSTEHADYDYPYIVKNKLIVQTYPYGKYLGFLRTTFDEDGKRVAVDTKSNPILLSSEVKQDPEVLKKVQEWAEEVKRKSGEVVGETKVYLNGSYEECWKQECTMGNLITNAALWYLNRFIVNGSSWQDSVTLALWHSSTINGSITNENTGVITVGDLFRSFPYHNTLYIVRIKGRHLKNMFEEAVSKYKKHGTMKFLQVAGVQVTYDIAQSSYSRVKELLVFCLNCSTPKYVPVEENTDYNVAMPSYLAHGRMFSSMVQEQMTDTELFDDDILKAYIRVMSPLTTAKDGRITFYKSTPSVTCTSKTETVFVTLIVVAALAVCAFVVYRYVVPRLRRRHGSTMALVH